MIHMEENCVFCKIVRGEIPATKVFENEHVIAIRDINPKARVHILVIPKKHIRSINQLTAEDTPLLGEVFSAIRRVAEQEGIAESGYSTLINTGHDGGQTVFHIHFHILGGEKMPW